MSAHDPLHALFPFLPRWLVSLLARRSVKALYALQNGDLASELYDVHEALDRLGAPGADELTAVERIEAYIRRYGNSEGRSDV